MGAGASAAATASNGKRLSEEPATPQTRNSSRPISVAQDQEQQQQQPSSSSRQLPPALQRLVLAAEACCDAEATEDNAVAIHVSAPTKQVFNNLVGALRRAGEAYERLGDACAELLGVTDPRYEYSQQKQQYRTPKKDLRIQVSFSGAESEARSAKCFQNKNCQLLRKRVFYIGVAIRDALRYHESMSRKLCPSDNQNDDKDEDNKNEEETFVDPLTGNKVKRYISQGMREEMIAKLDSMELIQLSTVKKIAVTIERINLDIMSTLKERYFPDHLLYGRHFIEAYEKKWALLYSLFSALGVKSNTLKLLKHGSLLQIDNFDIMCLKLNRIGDLQEDIDYRVQETGSKVLLELFQICVARLTKLYKYLQSTLTLLPTPKPKSKSDSNELLYLHCLTHVEKKLIVIASADHIQFPILIEQLMEFIEDAEDISQGKSRRSTFRITPLHVACLNLFSDFGDCENTSISRKIEDKLDSIRALIEYGANVNTKTVSGKTAAQLCQQSYDAFTRGAKNNTAASQLLVACQKELKTCKGVLHNRKHRKSPPRNCSITKESQEAMCIAAETCDIECMRSLIELHGLSIIIKSDLSGDGFTALHHAAVHCNGTSVRWLLEQCFDLGCTPGQSAQAGLIRRKVVTKDVHRKIIKKTSQVSASRARSPSRGRLRSPSRVRARATSHAKATSELSLESQALLEELDLVDKRPRAPQLLEDLQDTCSSHTDEQNVQEDEVAEVSDLDKSQMLKAAYSGDVREMKRLIEKYGQVIVTDVALIENGDEVEEDPADDMDPDDIRNAAYGQIAEVKGMTTALHIAATYCKHHMLRGTVFDINMTQQGGLRYDIQLDLVQAHEKKSEHHVHKHHSFIQSLENISVTPEKDNEESLVQDLHHHQHHHHHHRHHHHHHDRRRDRNSRSFHSIKRRIVENVPRDRLLLEKQVRKPRGSPRRPKSPSREFMIMGAASPIIDSYPAAPSTQEIDDSLRVGDIVKVPDPEHPGAVRWLLESTEAIKNINVPSISGRTPLHIACDAAGFTGRGWGSTYERIDAVSALLENGANKNLESNTGRASIDYINEIYDANAVTENPTMHAFTHVKPEIKVRIMRLKRLLQTI